MEDLPRELRAIIKSYSEWDPKDIQRMSINLAGCRVKNQPSLRCRYHEVVWCIGAINFYAKYSMRLWKIGCHIPEQLKDTEIMMRRIRAIRDFQYIFRQ